MRLFHATTAENAKLIAAEGFRRSNVRDSAGSSWLASSPDLAAGTSAAKGAVVIVDMPDDVAAQYLYRFDDGEPYEGNYLVPWEVLNERRPFEVMTL